MSIEEKKQESMEKQGDIKEQRSTTSEALLSDLECNKKIAEWEYDDEIRDLISRLEDRGPWQIKWYDLFDFTSDNYVFLTEQDADVLGVLKTLWERFWYTWLLDVDYNIWSSYHWEVLDLKPNNELTEKILKTFDDEDYFDTIFNWSRYSSSIKSVLNKFISRIDLYREVDSIENEIINIFWWKEKYQELSSWLNVKKEIYKNKDEKDEFISYLSNSIKEQWWIENIDKNKFHSLFFWFKK